MNGKTNNNDETLDKHIPEKDSGNPSPEEVADEAKEAALEGDGGKPSPADVAKAAKEAAAKSADKVESKDGVEVEKSTEDKIAETVDSEKKKDKKRKILVIILLLVALGFAGAGGYMLWKSQQKDVDPGATIQETSGKTTKEIQDELDKQVEKSRMTISVAPTITLKDGKARVNVVNVKDNRYYQKFTLTQNDKTVYESGTIKCGQKVEWCDADGLEEGTATITVQALNKKDGKAFGNPQSVSVKVEKESK